MITLAEATYQVRRMAALKYYAPTPESEEELIKIAAMARDLAWCIKVIDDFLNGPEQECPTPRPFKLAISPPRPELYRVPEKLTCPRGMCNGSGWIQEFWMHSKKGEGEYAYVKKEQISEEEYNVLTRKVDWNLQMLYEGSRKCPCIGGVERKRPQIEGRRQANGTDTVQ